jgi:hypothetical protein
MISWLLLVELAGFCYCIGRAADHFGQVHLRDAVERHDGAPGGEREIKDHFLDLVGDM